MRYKLLFSLIILATLGTAFATASAGSKNQALTACKAHISGLYHEGLRTKLKKIRQRKGHTEIKINVSADGERFNALCIVAKNGDLTYSTDREITERVATKE